MLLLKRSCSCCSSDSCSCRDPVPVNPVDNLEAVSKPVQPSAPPLEPKVIFKKIKDLLDTKKIIIKKNYIQVDGNKYITLKPLKEQEDKNRMDTEIKGYINSAFDLLSF